jgi:hypothetical protein
LELSEQADLIDEIVNKTEGTLSKKQCFDAIKDTLPSSISDKAKNVYLSRLHMEKHRQDTKKIHAEVALAKEGAQALGGEVVLDEILAQIEKKDGNISNGAIGFVRAAEKHRQDTEKIHAEVALAKKGSQASGGEVVLDEILAQIEQKDGNISNNAIEFVRAKEKLKDNVNAKRMKLLTCVEKRVECWSKIKKIGKDDIKCSRFQCTGCVQKLYRIH